MGSIRCSLPLVVLVWSLLCHNVHTFISLDAISCISRQHPPLRIIRSPFVISLSFRQPRAEQRTASSQQEIASATATATSCHLLHQTYQTISQCRPSRQATFALSLSETSNPNEHPDISIALDINQQDQHGLTSLHWAAIQNNPRVVETLVEMAGCQVDVADPLGFTALHYAASGGVVLEGRQKTTEMREADRLRMQIVQILIDSGAEVGATAKDGFTPMHGAVSSGMPDMETLLIKHGAVFPLPLPEEQDAEPVGVTVTPAPSQEIVYEPPVESQPETHSDRSTITSSTHRQPKKPPSAQQAYKIRKTGEMRKRRSQALRPEVLATPKSSVTLIREWALERGLARPQFAELENGDKGYIVTVTIQSLDGFAMCSFKSSYPCASHMDAKRSAAAEALKFVKSSLEDGAVGAPET